MFSQAFGQQAGASDDFQELCSEEKGVKKKFSMDAALEDKICDLYDLFVDVQICPFSALSWKMSSFMVEGSFLILSYSLWF